MIRVSKNPPPAHYFNLVRDRGNTYLRRKPNPSSSEFSRHSYWREIHDDLYKMYHGVCSYCASWTPRSSSGGQDRTSVDHFIPKSVNPYFAYDWDNFRLCRTRINTNKGNSLVVIDPFFVVNGWFRIDFTSFLVVSDDQKPPYLKSRIDSTIDVLGLNNSQYVDERVEIIRQYCIQAISISELNQLYPFIAAEIIRTNFDNILKPQMKSVLGW